MRTNGYGSYRGRSRMRTFLKVLLVLLVILLVLLVAAFFLLEPYMVYSSDGLHLRLPFSQQGQEETPPVQPSASLPLVVVDPTPTPTPEPEAIHAVLLPRTALYDGTAARQVEEAGANAAVFDMKADDGSLGYVSALPLALEAGTSDANPAINAAVQLLNTEGLDTVARVSCFRDDAVPYHDNTTSIRTSAGNWRDADGIRWLSPNLQNARDYVAGVCAELAALGFDEILLDNCAWPTSGSLDYILRGDTYPADGLSESLGIFYAQVREALSDYPEVKISMTAGAAVLTGDQEDAGGQTMALLAQYADRVWAPAAEGEADYDRAMAGAGMQAWQLVTITEDALNADKSWAILPGL